jgi:hypothetical protein
LDILKFSISGHGKRGEGRGFCFSSYNVPDQSRQEETTGRLHDQASPREHEPDLRALVRDADVHGQRHGDSNAHGAPVQRTDGRFPTAIDRQDDPPTAISVFPNRLLTAVEDGRLQISARAEHPPVARLHDAFDAVVNVEERVGEFQLAGHSHGEGIVVLGAVEGHEDYGRHFGAGFGDVGDFDLGEGEIGVVLG